MSDEAITVTGLKEVQKSIYAFSQQLGDKVVLSALRAGANVIRRAYKNEISASGIKVRSGNLQSGFTIARSKIHRGKLSTDMIGVYLSLKKGKNAPFYGRFLNDGWNTHGAMNESRQNRKIKRFVAYTNRSVGSSRVTQRGKTDVPGRHFIQKAFEANKESALRVILSDALAGAELLARKVGL